MLISQKNLEIRKAISDFDRRIEHMHAEFTRYLNGSTRRMPEWEKLEAELTMFSRTNFIKIDVSLSSQMDRVLYKFQNRKKIWLSQAKEMHGGT
jgi:hypothetical protein